MQPIEDIQFRVVCDELIYHYSKLNTALKTYYDFIENGHKPVLTKVVIKLQQILPTPLGADTNDWQ